jgi:hypothetical protein
MSDEKKRRLVVITVGGNALVREKGKENCRWLNEV